MNIETIKDVIEKVLPPFIVKDKYVIKLDDVYMSSSKYKKYPTWVIAFCPDSNSFFATDERCFFWESEEEFESEESAIDYFSKHVDHFIEINNEIMVKAIYGWIPVNEVFLENNRTWYS